MNPFKPEDFGDAVLVDTTLPAGWIPNHTLRARLFHAPGLLQNPMRVSVAAADGWNKVWIPAPAWGYGIYRWRAFKNRLEIEFGCPWQGWIEAHRIPGLFSAKKNFAGGVI